MSKSFYAVTKLLKYPNIGLRFGLEEPIPFNIILKKKNPNVLSYGRFKYSFLFKTGYYSITKRNLVVQKREEGTVI